MVRETIQNKSSRPLKRFNRKIINRITQFSAAGIIGLIAPVLAQQSNPSPPIPHNCSSSPSSTHQLTPYEWNRVVTSWVQAAGVLVAAAAFVISLRKNRQDQKKNERDRQVALYESLKSEWSAFFVACRNNPDLDIFFLPLQRGEGILEEEQLKQSNNKRLEQIGFAQLFWIVQRNYVRADQDELLAELQRAEWNAFLSEYFKRYNCLDAWDELKGFYDKKFVEYIESNYASKSRIVVSNELEE